MARKHLRYIFLDLPGDHEIDLSLPTESAVLHGLLTNLGRGARSKVFRCSSKDSLSKLPNYHYDPKFVHLSCHASKKQIGLVGDSISWETFANKHLKPLLNELETDHKRILFLSCCRASDGVKALKPHLSKYFTGAYFFSTETISFADSLLASAMFYKLKPLNNPHIKILKRINEFFAKKILYYDSIS